MRKTKIICTLGPATDNDRILREMILEGMDVARFNFSHSTHADQKERYDRLCRIREELNMPVAAMLDTKGPEIRLGTFKNKSVDLIAGNIFTLTTREVEGDESFVNVNYAGLPGDVTEGSTVLLDDGHVELTVLSTSETDITCRIVNSGTMSDRKGVNLPDSILSMEFISPKDREDIIFGIENGFDFIAASFTRSAEDILAIRHILEEHDCHTIRVIAKIENREGVENIQDILRVADGIMVARGDMGVELPIEKIPGIQKRLIKLTVAACKPVITATQMLDSMMKNPRPTRAEATDVANAIYDNTSAIMLSGETAAGLYPVESLKTMSRIAETAEQDINYLRRFRDGDYSNMPDVTNAISHASCMTANDLNARAIVTVTHSGGTARMLSRFRPNCPIVACTPFPQVARQLNLCWGTKPFLIDMKENADDLFDSAMEAAVKSGMASDGDIAVFTAGMPLGIAGTTNLMKVHTIGHELVKGQGVNGKSVRASLCVCETEKEAAERFEDGNILVLPHTSNDILPLLKRAAGIVTETAGLSSHAAIVGLALDIPVVVGAQNATKILKSGSFVLLDAARGMVLSD